jgi:epsilon-lactone hydrolase
MSQPERKSFLELLSAVPLDARGDVAVLRRVFEQFMLQTPLPSDVSLTDMTLGGVPALEISVPEAIADAALLYFHGGVFALGSARASAGLACLLARQARAKVLSVDYRLAPEHPYPAATDDALVSYRGLIETGIRPERIGLFGESAGGALALGALVAARDAGLAQPAAAVLYSPWLDLTLPGILGNHRLRLAKPRSVGAGGTCITRQTSRDTEAGPRYACPRLACESPH